MALYSIILHNGLWRVTEHLSNIQIEWLHTIALLEREVGIASGLTYYIQRSTLALSNLSNVLNVLLVDEQAHTLLTLVGNDFLARKGLVTDRQFGHINLTTTLLNELRQTVQMTSRTVVVNTHNGVHIFFAQGAHQVVGTLLHLRVSTLYGVQLDTVAVATRIH